MEKAENENIFDLNKMLYDFETAQRHQAYYSKIKNKFKLENKKYQKRVELMKEKREEMLNQRRSELQSAYEKRQKSIDLNIKNLKKQNSFNTRNNFLESKLRNEKLNQTNELTRRKYENTTKQKLKLFQERYENLMKEKHEKNVLNLQKQETKHNEYIINQNKRKIKILSETERKNLNQFVTAYLYKKSREDEIKERAINSYEKEMRKTVNLQNIENEKLKLRNETIKRMEKMEKKKNEILKKKQNESKISQEKRNELGTTCRENHSKYLKQNFSENFEILINQRYLMEKSILKDKITELKKVESQKRINNEHINFEKGLEAFFKKIEIIKSNSVFKKSLGERKEIYKQKKNLEKLEKQKEEEENLLNLKINNRLDNK